MKFKLRLSPALKSIVRGIFYRPGWYRGNYSMLDRLFRHIEDPWNFETSEYERERFDLLIEAVQRYPHERVLEVGCAEGIFTERLQRVAREVVAIDVSETAIERARRRAPNVTYVQKGIEDFDWPEPFDLVVCMETLYYIKDVDRALERISSLGEYTLVSYLGRELKNLDQHIEHKPLLEFSKFEKVYGLVKYSMRLAVWKNDGIQIR